MSLSTLEALVKIGLLIGGLMTAAAYLVLLERWMAAWCQDRVGPNRVGIPLTKFRLFGLGQPLADGAKFILKEEYTPAHVDKPLFVLAPITILASALAIFAAIPFGSYVPNPGVPGLGEQIKLVVAPGMNVGLIFVFALSSIAVYGVVLGGWASNNKYSFFGGLRSSAQLIAYELPMGLGLLGVVLAAGSLNLEEIMLRQAESGWFVLAQPLGFLVFFVAAFAEAGRLPFDLPECEQELVGGYHTEYAGLKLLMFLVAEFLHMITASFLIVILFLGGWHLPFGITGAADQLTGWGSSEPSMLWAQAALRIVVLMVKIFLVILFFMLTRWSWPRFRFDQLMALAWKIMLPLGLINFTAVAVLDEAQRLWSLPSPLVWSLNWVVCLASLVIMGMFGPSVSDNRLGQPETEVV